MEREEARKAAYRKVADLINRDGEFDFLPELVQRELLNVRDAMADAGRVDVARRPDEERSST